MILIRGERRALRLVTRIYDVALLFLLSASIALHVNPSAGYRGMNKTGSSSQCMDSFRIVLLNYKAV